jgi:hypothetical protein
MRQIKFRVWDKEKKEYFSIKNGMALMIGPRGFNIGFNTHQGVYPIPDTGQENLGENRFILEQFTGLKDKNDKEIYEGDIIKHEFGNPTTSVVDWISQKDGWDYTGWMIEHYMSQYGEIEVIGNIHENPELCEN